MFTEKWIHSFTIFLFTVVVGPTTAYSNQWATHILGGDDVALEVARNHGLRYLGKIVDDWYHFEYPTLVKRSAQPHMGMHKRLLNDTRIRRAEQQRVKSRKKRDLIPKHGPTNVKGLFNDDKWPHMWYLNRGHGLDMNVMNAWALGRTGRGVVVSILDDGLENDHPDLIKNYDPQASFDVNSHDKDPMPRYDPAESNRHGTRCAGEVAATANNSICAVGVAYEAGVGGVRMLDGDVTDAVEARSLSLNSQHIDIYSASWGPDDDGKTVDGPGELATRAFIEGITKGRNKKGSIFVWASGNGGRDYDNCNCDGYTNSIWTLSISSATEHGSVPWYSEACSSTLATTYSSGGTGEKQVITTDLHHRCTSTHTGTSASAPLAAGICALALQANMNLTWRDMQHIVVRTANPSNLKANDWVTNGVGRRVSHSFGYGLMDATAMVLLAEKWRTVPEQHKCEVSGPQMNRKIPPRSQIVLVLTVQECRSLNFLEHVQAKISLMASRRGDLRITLTSPQNTTSTLLAKRPHDISEAGFNQWPFMSVHMWGERPHGKWKLEIHNEGRYLGRATLLEWALIFHGTTTSPDRSDNALYSSASVNSPRKPLPKSSNYSRNGLNTFSMKGKQLTKLVKTNGSNMSQPYVVNIQNQTSKKSKARGQHKNGKSTNKLLPRPTMQTSRGLASGRVSSVTSKPRSRSTPKPIIESTMKPTNRPQKQRIAESPTSSPLQRGLILMEPPIKTATNKVPVVFQQYPKIQQLYPLYPIYAGARGVDQHTTRIKGLDLLQDEQFDSRHLQLTDKEGILKEWKLVFYGTETSFESDDALDHAKPASPVVIPDESDNNKGEFDGGQNAVDTEGDPWTGRQQLDQISHPEVQKPTTENQTSDACHSSNLHGCLECQSGWYLFEGHCVLECPQKTYEDNDRNKNVCNACHYTCAMCSGSTDMDCTLCYADASPSLDDTAFQCILKSLEWRMQSTVWFYRMSIIFIVNAIAIILTLICLYTRSFKRSKKGIFNSSNVFLPKKSENDSVVLLDGSISDSD